MKRKTMSLSVAAIAVLALAGLPGVAAGEFGTTPAVSPVPPASLPLSFSGAGGAAQLIMADGTTVNCTSTSLSGNLEESMTGSLKVSFHGCRENVLNSTCTTAGGDSSGTITTTTLKTHTVYLAGSSGPHERPGILLTGNEGHIMTFSCAGGFVKNVVTGNVLGTVTSPGIGSAASNSMTIDLTATHGGQEHVETVSGTEYGLESQKNGGSYQPAYLNLGAVATNFASGAEAATTT